jgi:hypothetical protein
MRKIALLAGIAMALPLAALADRLPIPADAPGAFKTECGSCHFAFPPGLLMAGDWRKVMATLDRHYGDNASLDDRTRRAIEDFLVRHAATDKRYSGAGDPPRLTATIRFQRKHREVPPGTWKDPRVVSAANCSACHSRAEQGSYRERELTLPGGRYRERD